MPVPSVGDILMISQVAWKIGRAFSVGRKDAPAEFVEVEMGISGLAKALKLLAEALHAESEKSLFQTAAKKVQDGISTMLASCRRTVNDLDSMIGQYQVIRKHQTAGGFAIERSWSDLVLAEYRTMMWTMDGGNLQNLRDLLQMHTISVTLLIQALQSKSLPRLESIVAPMAERVDGMYHTPKSLGQQPDDIHRIVQDLTLNTPPIQASPIPMQNPARSPTVEEPDSWSPASSPVSPPGSPLRRQSTQISLSQDRQWPSPPSAVAPSYATNTLSTSRGSLSSRRRVSGFNLGSPTPLYSSSSYASDAGTSSAGWPSPGPLKDSLVSRTPSTQPEIMKLHQSSATASQTASFEKEAFRNSAILCDIRGKLVEYSHRINEDDPKDVEMIQACGECRIAVVRKRVHDPEMKSMQLVTSVWSFSDDGTKGTVRAELRLDDEEMFIPYSSYFSPSKVSITVPCQLKFHDVRLGSRPAKTAKTSWVNYVFETPQAAALFQNELMGRTLLATFRTEKTMRSHEGLGKSFSYAEQMCGLENLRVWEDSNTGAIIALIHFSADFRNGYLAFYLNSSINPIKVKDDGGREVKIKGLRVPLVRGDRAMRKDSVVTDGGKVKGKEGEAGKKISKKEKEKVISGAKIEFASDMEKKEFLAMVKEMQKNMIELPDLLGVN